jgi:c-di-AMP phosphodiesterase-like protein
LKQKDIYRLYYVAALFLFLFGVFIPCILKPIYVIIRKSVLIVVTVSMKSSLCIVFYLLVTPIGLVVRLLYPDILRIKIDKSRVSYWEKKTERIFTRSDYERQF